MSTNTNITKEDIAAQRSECLKSSNSLGGFEQFVLGAERQNHEYLKSVAESTASGPSNS